MKLNYTLEMQFQDKLWESEKEDTGKMSMLYEEIINEAKQFGFSGVYEIGVFGGEAVIEIFDSEEEKERLQNSGDGIEFCFGFCKPLINCLEKYYLKSEVL